ncbi:hypothetical protein FT663_02077 [Candidozyma haemuli var. vulneris]|nr:hypothetical protein FT662_02508 [[Candida] haemuloni var. vulneris]KAF3993068.1 hypothetical protein FT663_02077 [[Candida] haemuloni var. vulneris]
MALPSPEESLVHHDALRPSHLHQPHQPQQPSNLPLQRDPEHHDPAEHHNGSVNTAKPPSHLPHPLPPPHHHHPQQPQQHQSHQPHQPQHQPQPQPQHQPHGQTIIDDSRSSAPKTQTVFIHKLYDMLEDQTLSHLIWWSPTHDSFCLYPGEEFSNVLAQYFKHTNIASFIRQLNMYGFHKVNDSFHSDEKGQGSAPQTPTGQTRWEFRHAANQFRKGDVDSLRLIKRKSSKVMSTPKEIVNLKSLPPTSNPASTNNTSTNATNDSDSESPESASKQQYHRSLYQQSWKQQSAQKPNTPSSPNGHPSNPPNSMYYQGYPAVHPYPGIPHSMTMPVPVSPSSPPYPEHPIPTPSSYVSQSQSRQASNQTSIAVDQSINLKLIEMSTSISSLRASYDELQHRYDSLYAGYQQNQQDMVQLLDILESGEEERLKTPGTTGSTPAPDSLRTSVSVDEVRSFRKRILSRNGESERPATVPATASVQASASAPAAPPQNIQNGPASGPGPEESLSRVSSNSNIVPQHYPLNPNYSLYNNSENGFRHFKLGSEDSQAQNNRHFSVLMDPLQTKALKGPGEELKSSSPLSAANQAKDSRPPVPLVQQYQPKVSQQSTPSLYQPFMRNESAHQQRTVSLPILDKVMPQTFSSQQRHSTTALLNNEKRPLSPGHVAPIGTPAAKTYTSNPMATSAPIQAPPSNAPSPAPTSSSPQPQTQFEAKGVLPSVKELDKSIKRSASGRLSDILTDDEDPNIKKVKTEN